MRNARRLFNCLFILESKGIFGIILKSFQKEQNLRVCILAFLGNDTDGSLEGRSNRNHTDVVRTALKIERGDKGNTQLIADH